MFYNKQDLYVVVQHDGVNPLDSYYSAGGIVFVDYDEALFHANDLNHNNDKGYLYSVKSLEDAFDEYLDSEKSSSWDDGHSEGYRDGKREGYDEGYSEGESCGRTEGFNEGYDEGYKKGKEDASD